MATKLTTVIDLKGPFFTKDIRKTVAQNKLDFLDLVATTGQEDVRAQLQAGESTRQPLGGGIRPARVSGHVIGRTHNLVGKRWKATAVVSVQNAGLSRSQGIKLMAAASLLEHRGHAFRRTKGRLQRLARRADLLKGLR